MRTVSVATMLVLAVAAVGAAQPPDGERLYNQNCARCHEGNLPALFSSGPIREYPAERIYEALSAGLMTAQATGLSKADKRAVAEYVSGSAPGSMVQPLDQIPEAAYCASGGAVPSDPYAGPSWNGWSPDRSNARFQSAEAAGLTANSVPDLSLKWAFGFPGVTVASFQATIVGGRAMVGTGVGVVYALNAKTGCIHWVHETAAGVRSTITVGPGPNGRATAFFGDLTGNAYAVDFETGERRWKVEVDDHRHARITGAPALHGGRLYVPVASLEEVAAEAPSYQCCTFRGSIVALDARTGRQLWKRYSIDEVPVRTGTSSAGVAQWGPSGVGIWASPTLDPDRNQMYVATGDSYSNPVAPESDAIMALAMDTGAIRWVTQTTPGDAFTIACMSGSPLFGALTGGTTPDAPILRANCPESEGPDHDYGSSPVLITTGGGDLLLGGQKSGVMYGLRPTNGEIVWETRVSDGGLLGGIEWGFATDGDQVYVSISDMMEKAPGEAGGVTALQVRDGELVWHAPPVQDTCGGRQGCHTAQPAAVSLIPGVAFAGSLDGHLRAYATDTGRIIWDFDTARDFETVNGVEAHGGALNGPGPTIVDGMLYVVSGYGSFGMSGNVLLAFTVEE